MKQKLFYLLVFICSLSLFSSAHQSRNNCNDHSFIPAGKLKCTKQSKPVKKETGSEFSAFNVFLFNI